MMIVCCAVWFALLIVFAQMQSPVGGMMGRLRVCLSQSRCLGPMAAWVVRNSGAQFRGRIMGIRMLMIYGVPIGLLTSGPLIGRFGYPTTATLYCVIGLAVTLLIAVRWHADLWRLEAPANFR